MTLQTSETADRLRQGDLTYFSLWVPDVERAATFFSAVLGWRYAQASPDRGRQVEGLAISHGIAELGGTAEYMRRLGVPLARELSSPAAYAVFVVDDAKASAERVRAAGGWAAAPAQTPYGLQAACIDDQGMPFSLHEVPAAMRPPRPPTGGTRPGDIAYLVFEYPDAERARAFLGSVLGLQFSPGVGGGWNIADVVPMGGVAGGRPQPTIVPMYRVDDIQEAVERVRAAGGTATNPVVEPYGTRAECVDDQGTRFMLGGISAR